MNLYCAIFIKQISEKWRTFLLKPKNLGKKIYFSNIYCNERYLRGVHLPGDLVNVGDVRALIRIRINALRHQAPQAGAVQVRGQRRVVALKRGNISFIMYTRYSLSMFNAIFCVLSFIYYFYLSLLLIDGPLLLLLFVNIVICLLIIIIGLTIIVIWRVIIVICLVIFVMCLANLVIAVQLKQTILLLIFCHDFNIFHQVILYLSGYCSYLWWLLL